jgi:hypothetical protein
VKVLQLYSWAAAACLVRRYVSVGRLVEQQLPGGLRGA